jgi:AraC-like DNA-binding protein
MNGVIYQVQDESIRNNPRFGIRSLGINGANPPRLFYRSQGMETLLFLQLHSPGKITGVKTKENASIIWPPRSPHDYGNKNIPWTNSWIHFTGSYSFNLLKKYKIPIGSPFYLKRSQLFDKYLNMFLEELRNHPKPNESILISLYHIFLLEVERDLNESKTNSIIHEGILKAKDLADTVYYQKLSLRDFSRACHLSENYLTGEFKKTFGLSLIDYLIKVRISHARELLGNVNLPISHIAESCGYEDGAYFSKLFKKQTGFSPTEYRRRNE